jgi:hypothetical protein
VCDVPSKIASPTQRNADERNSVWSMSGVMLYAWLTIFALHSPIWSVMAVRKSLGVTPENFGIKVTPCELV